MNRPVSKPTVGQGQYRNAVASGLTLDISTFRYCSDEVHPTLPRYGTDPVQVSLPNFEAKTR